MALLLVDDDPDAAATTAEMLERSGEEFAVETATSASEGLEALERRDVDCVVSDYRMPDMDGLDFLEAVRDAHPDLPFVLFTGRGDESVAAEAVSAGATDYLRKRGGEQQYALLANRIRNAVEQYRSRRRAAALERIRGLVADVDQALVHATDREALERRVCEILSDADPYVFAWIGNHDPETETVEARTGAGVEAGYLDAIEITTDGSETSRGPTGEAIRTRELAVSQDLATDEAYEPWREAARDRGYRSSAAVPLVHEETLYGVLNLYAGRPDAFDGQERSLLAELGDDVAYAIHAQELQAARERRVARLNALFEQSPDMVDIHDADGRIVEANPQFAEKLGYDVEAVVGTCVWDVDQRADPEDARAALDAMEPGDRVQVDARYERADGTTFPAKVHVRRLDLPDDEQFLVFSRDVTERRDRERELARYERLVENLPIGVFRATPGADGELRLVNEEMLELFDADSTAELKSHSVAELYVDADRRTHVSETLLADGELESEELRLETLAGEPFWAEVSAVAVEDDGETVFEEAIRDVTERKVYEQRLTESEERYRSLARAIDTSSVGTFILDDEFDVVWINEAVEEYFHVDRDDVVGADKPALIESEIKHLFERPDRFAETVEASYRDNDYVESFECHVVPGPDREERWLLHWSTPITEGQYAGGRIEHYTDISERKRYEHRLEEQRDDLTLLNQVLRHDVRNDLQLVTAYADLLSDACGDDEELRSYVETVRESADHAVELTTTARDMAEVMLTEESTEGMPLRETVERELREVRSAYPEASVADAAAVPAVTVRADDMLGSVFRNLLKNAVQHNDADVPEVSVSGTVEDGAVVVRVADNGPGVPDDRKGAIFGKGEKGLDSHGTGIGLYLVRTLVEVYGGDVWVEDDDPRGAVFAVELPLAE